MVFGIGKCSLYVIVERNWFVKNGMERRDAKACNTFRIAYNNFGFEFKWNERKAKNKCPESFSTAYPEASFKIITPKNIEEFLMI